MKKTSRTDGSYEGKGEDYTQSPNAISNDLVTNQDLNGLANDREKIVYNPKSLSSTGQIEIESVESQDADSLVPGGAVGKMSPVPANGRRGISQPHTGIPSIASSRDKQQSLVEKLKYTIITFGKFVGPGFLVSVAYIDPGNYATDIVAGASYRFRLLFVILISNLIAIFLQSLAIKLGTVTGLNLAEACRAFLPKWMNYFLYAMAEVAIIATDIAEVIGTAIALNLLIPQLPLVAGCALSILDVMIILIWYQPQGGMRGLRFFEFGVMLLVLAVVVCFCLQLSLIRDTTPGEVFKGYLPNNAVTDSRGLLQSCGILGATVMPHSLYLGSGMVQSRLREYDETRGLLPSSSSEGQPSPTSSVVQDDKSGVLVRVEPDPSSEGQPSPAGSVQDDKSSAKTYYVPSLAAIKHSLKYSYAETALSLFTFALFVNSAILIVAGASLYGNDEALEADIFGIHGLLSESISPAAGTIFALALLFSGVSAGIVCTISGQMVCEGALHWRLKPWVRRLVTRSISITPSIIIAGAAGREKLNAALNGSQVALSVVLPFVSAPLIYFTCTKRHMRVRPGAARFVVEGIDAHIVGENDGGGSGSGSDSDAEKNPRDGTRLGGAGGQPVCMVNNWCTTVLGVLIWLLIVVMNVANIVLLGVEGA